jgi:two-component system CheB/CheR fusion protein
VRNASQRILVVDDDVDAAATLSDLLEDLGHEVSVVVEGRQALERARAFRPAVVILDLAMPGTSGYELAPLLRESPELAGTRLVALSGYDREEDRRRVRAAGFDQHWVKPLAPDDLGDLLTDLGSDPLPA